MYTLSKVKYLLSTAGEFRYGYHEIVDLKRILDQYSDRPGPVIQVITYKQPEFRVDQLKGGVSAGDDQYELRIYYTYEEILPFTK